MKSKRFDITWVNNFRHIGRVTYNGKEIGMLRGSAWNRKENSYFSWTPVYSQSHWVKAETQERGYSQVVTASSDLRELCWWLLLSTLAPEALTVFQSVTVEVSE